MFYCDRAARILDVNEAFTKHYGYTAAEAVGKTPRILRSRHSTDELYRDMWSSLLDPKIGAWHGQMINRAKDGREVPVVMTITAVRNEAGETVGYLSNALDMTDRFSLQAKLADSQALAAIGEMVAVVAHEIRNPLGSIVMAAKQLAGDALGAADRRLVLSVLRSESQRLNAALTSFLSYARPRDLKLGRSELNALVSEVCRMVRSNAELLKEVSLQVELAPRLDAFAMDADQVRQVLWNIVLNALQAMAGKGTLSVETGRLGGEAFFRVRDTGPGVPPEKLATIFKAFHTTKQQGTGLGLAIAERIVKAHGGRITVENRGGAVFTVYLPSLTE